MSTTGISVRTHGDETLHRFRGRDAWALAALIDAGERGVTPLSHVGPRWSGYIFNLRKAGLVIETIHEHHGGPYAGRHGRYVLRSRLTVVTRNDGSERKCDVAPAENDNAVS